MSLAEVEIDVIDYRGTTDFFVYTEYLDTRVYNIIVKRLDSSEGWEENISVFVNYLHSGVSETVVVGPSKTNEKVVTRSVIFDLRRSSSSVSIPKNYELAECPEYIFVSRQVFNRLFKSDIVQLPKNIFAVGVRRGLLYLYSESNDYLYMIELTIKTLISVALSKKLFREFYFLICASDGFMEHQYGSTPRTKCRTIGDVEMAGKDHFLTINENEFPIFHKGLYVLGQSVQKLSPYAISVVDRYYLCMNKYNEYRSIHRGIGFLSKTSAIVFASRPRGSKFNFTNRRDISVSQREYFYSSAVEKDNIVCPEYISREEMIQYKYILDIDGWGSTWDATAWKLNSGSVILKADSVWRQWFYDEYLPWVHYVPVAEDFNDIQEKFAWCENNTELCLTMIQRCKELFQRIYRFSNIIDSSAHTLFKLNSLVPCVFGEKRVFFLSNSDDILPNVLVNKAPNLKSRLEILSDVYRKLHPSDIIVMLNTGLIDVHNYDLGEFLKIYASFNSAIVFGAEKNLWPETLEPQRAKLMNLEAGEFKYLNAGFFVAEVGELERIFEDYPIEHFEINDQEYFTRIYLTGKYSFKLDTNSRLVINTYKCGFPELREKIEGGTQFVHFNAGR
jgi:hypothetical protein